jgi:hypothetical protein
MKLFVNIVARNPRLICPFQPTFFGLNDRYIENVYEQFFVLQYHGGWSFTEAYNLPITLREWFVERLGKQFQDEKEQIESSQRKTNRR